MDRQRFVLFSDHFIILLVRIHSLFVEVICILTVTVCVTESFVLHPLLKTEGTSQNNQNSLFPVVHGQTGIKMFSVNGEK